MMFLNSSTQFTVLVAIVITMFEPTTAELRHFMRQSVVDSHGACTLSKCRKDPSCPIGYSSLLKLKDDCSYPKRKRYCCIMGQGPQCLFTDCGQTTCPPNYHKIDRNHDGCLGSRVKSYCCKTNDTPQCFDLSCPTDKEAPKKCPPDFNEMTRARGSLGGCDSDITERVTCCFPGFELSNDGYQIVNRTSNYSVNQGVNPNAAFNGNQGGHPNTGYTGYNGNQGVYSNAGFNGNQGVNPNAGNTRNHFANLNNATQFANHKRTYKMENGHIVFVGNSPSSFGAFTHTLLLLPILIVLSAFKSASFF